MSESEKQQYYLEAQKVPKSPRKTKMVKGHPIKKEKRQKKATKR